MQMKIQVDGAVQLIALWLMTLGSISAFNQMKIWKEILFKICFPYPQVVSFHNDVISVHFNEILLNNPQYRIKMLHCFPLIKCIFMGNTCGVVSARRKLTESEVSVRINVFRSDGFNNTDMWRNARLCCTSVLCSDIVSVTVTRCVACSYWRLVLCRQWRGGLVQLHHASIGVLEYVTAWWLWPVGCPVPSMCRWDQTWSGAVVKGGLLGTLIPATRWCSLHVHSREDIVVRNTKELYHKVLLNTRDLAPRNDCHISLCPLHVHLLSTYYIPYQWLKQKNLFAFYFAPCASKGSAEGSGSRGLVFYIV